MYVCPQVYPSIKENTMKVVVLGGGMVGSAIARDLAKDAGTRVVVADVSDAVLKKFRHDQGIETEQADLSTPAAIASVIGDADLVIGAVPGHMGYMMLRTVIEAGKNIVDISFFPEDALSLDEFAKEHGVVAVVDCGLAPGLSNLLMGRAHATMDRVDRFACYVGGLPVVRKQPFEYAAVFSPVDVIEEYTRPARYLEHGRLVVKPALTDVEHLHFDGIGTLEAFNSDGLRTLAVTMPVPNMIEKTMRYPGHADVMRLLRDCGFFGKEPVDVRGAAVRPLDLTAKLMFPMWELGPGEEDYSIMRVVIEGERDGIRQRITSTLLDRYDRSTNTTSMARTTGYTCSVAARLVAGGLYDRKGVSPPEYLGEIPAVHDALLDGLRRRGIAFVEDVQTRE
jgi:lysine 6-dehydrogenase